MREQCVPGSLSSSPAQEPGNEATYSDDVRWQMQYQSGPMSNDTPCTTFYETILIKVIKKCATVISHYQSKSLLTTKSLEDSNLNGSISNTPYTISWNYFKLSS